jgi:hypothetical protein
MGLDNANVPLVFPNVDRYDDFIGNDNLMAYTTRTIPFLAGI